MMGKKRPRETSEWDPAGPTLTECADRLRIRTFGQEPRYSIR